MLQLKPVLGRPVNCQIVLVHSNIETLEVDAIVNAANTLLKAGKIGYHKHNASHLFRRWRMRRNFPSGSRWPTPTRRMRSQQSLCRGQRQNHLVMWFAKHQRYRTSLAGRLSIHACYSHHPRSWTNSRRSPGEGRTSRSTWRLLPTRPL